MLATRCRPQQKLQTIYKRSFSAYKIMEENNKKIIAVCQMTATNQLAENFVTVKRLVETAKENNAQMVFLPEGCDYIGASPLDTVGMATTLDGQLIQDYCSLAKTCGIWLSIGGVHEKITSEKIHNAHIIIDDKGSIVSVYRKIHLYDVNLPDKNIVIRESDSTARGQTIVPPVKSPVGSIGLETCYDLRFPELSLALRKMGAEILTFPSAFMKRTGEAHWEALLRARAIECQCYVVAAAQSGEHNSKRTSWGQAMIVDPWGTVLDKCTADTDIVYAKIDLDLLYTTREQMPLWEQRRTDLYPALTPHDAPQTAPKQDVYQFGQVSVKSMFVFYTTDLIMAFTNKRCVVPGHVLVSPIRCAKRLSDLTTEEMAELFVVVQKVERVMERVHDVTSSTITVQDGKHAGQSIEHVHVHVLPRREGDFTINDHIYNELQNHDKTDKHVRSESDMADEAAMLRKYF